MLARFAALRRLRRLGSEVGDASLARMSRDLGDDLDALDDPAWTTLAACSEAVLAALEALRHLAMPRYRAAPGRSHSTSIRPKHRARHAPSSRHRGARSPSGPSTIPPINPPGQRRATPRPAPGSRRLTPGTPGPPPPSRAYQAALLERILAGRD